MSEGTGVLETLPFRVLIDEAMTLTRRHFRAIFPSVALPVLLGTVALTVAQARWMAGMSRLGAAPAFPAVVGSFALFMLGVAAFVAIKMVAYGAMMAGTVDVVAARPLSMGSCWGFMARPRVIGTIVLGTVATVVAFLFCFFPAIYVGLLLAYTLPVMRDEGSFGVEALRRSGAIARFNPRREWSSSSMLKTFLMFVVGGLISYAVSFMVQLPFVIAQQVVIFKDAASGEAADPAVLMESLLWLQVPGAILGSLAEVAVTLYLSFGLTLLYFDLRRRKEGGDLEAAVAALEARVGVPAGPGASPS